MQIFRALTKTFSVWFQQSFSYQLLLLVLLIGGLIAYLVLNAEKMPSRRFVGLSILTGLLGALLIGTGFRTLTVLKLVSPSFLPQVFHITVGSMVEKSLSWIKAMIALTAAGLSIYEGPAHRREEGPAKAVGRKGSRSFSQRCRSARTSATATSATSNFYHRWEFFHYYLGSKYDRELGYERLYNCAAVAQADSGQINEVRARKLRDLSDDVLAPAQVALDHPEDCRDRFTAERWEAFKDDVKFFRNSVEPPILERHAEGPRLQPAAGLDRHGSLLVVAAPRDDGYIKFLACFDLALLRGHVLRPSIGRSGGVSSAWRRSFGAANCPPSTSGRAARSCVKTGSFTWCSRRASSASDTSR